MSQPIETGNYFIINKSSELYADLNGSPDNGAQVIAKKGDGDSKTQKWYIEPAPRSTLPNTYTIRLASSDTAYLTALAPFPGAPVVTSTTSFPWAITQAKDGSYSIKPGTGPFESRSWSLHTGQEGEAVALQPGPVVSWTLNAAQNDDEAYDSDY